MVSFLSFSILAETSQWRVRWSGRTAVAGSIDLRTFVSLFTSADGRIFLSLPDLGVEKTWMQKDLVSHFR